MGNVFFFSLIFMVFFSRIFADFSRGFSRIFICDDQFDLCYPCSNLFGTQMTRIWRIYADFFYGTRMTPIGQIFADLYKDNLRLLDVH